MSALSITKFDRPAASLMRTRTSKSSSRFSMFVCSFGSVMGVPFREETVRVEATDSKRGVNPHQFGRSAMVIAPGGA